MLRLVTQVTLALALLTVSVQTVHAQAGAKAARDAYREGQELGNRGDIAGAIKKFEEAAKLDSKMDIAFLRLGLAYQLSHRWPEALAAYQTALAVTRRNKDEAYEGLGGLYRRMGHLRMAQEAQQSAITEAKKRKRPFPEAHYELALTYIELGQLDDAIRALREALKLRPEYLLATVRLANTLLANDELEEAEGMFQKMLENNPEDRNALYGLGLVEKRRDRRDEAREIFQKACKLGHQASCRETEVRYRTLH